MKSRFRRRTDHPYKTLDALIAFDISGSGEHAVKIVYSPDIIIIGGGISLASITAFSVFCIISYRRKKKAKTVISETE